MILIGYGQQMVSEYVPTLRLLGLSISGVYDISAERRGCAKKDGFLAVNSIEELTHFPSSTPVIVAIPPSALSGILGDLLNYGFKKVLVEKPPALSFSELIHTQSKIIQAGASVFVASKRRFEPTYTRLRGEMLRDDPHARISMKIHRCFRADRLGWRADPSEAGPDILFDLGYHAVDTVLWLAQCSNVSSVEDIEEECWASYPSRLIRRRVILGLEGGERKAEVDVDRVAPSPFEQIIVDYPDRQLIAQRHELYSIAKGGSISDVVIHRIDRTPPVAAMIKDFCREQPVVLGNYEQHGFHLRVLEMQGK